jgi:hypothetical protein
MNREQYLKFFKDTTDKMFEITKKKNHDYSGADGVNPFSNFTRVEALGICSTEQGFLTRMSDKMSRIATFVSAGELQVKDESVEDTLIDLANYSLLMLGYIKSKKKPEIKLTITKNTGAIWPEWNDTKVFNLVSFLKKLDIDSGWEENAVNSSLALVGYRSKYNIDQFEKAVEKIWCDEILPKSNGANQGPTLNFKHYLELMKI